MIDTDILELLPATYDQIAAHLGYSRQTVKSYISQMRKRGYNVRPVGRLNNWTLELIPEVVKLDVPKLATWREL